MYILQSQMLEGITSSQVSNISVELVSSAEGTPCKSTLAVGIYILLQCLIGMWTRKLKYKTSVTYLAFNCAAISAAEKQRAESSLHSSQNTALSMDLDTPVKNVKKALCGKNVKSSGKKSEPGTMMKMSYHNCTFKIHKNFHYFTIL